MKKAISYNPLYHVLSTTLWGMVQEGLCTEKMREHILNDCVSKGDRREKIYYD